jgi:carboxyl-terminal processing protease
MRFYLIFVVIFSILTSSETYEKINISEKKKDLSNEIYKKLSREHYVRNFNDQDFNKKYFEAIFDRLDGGKNYFIKSEVDYYLKAASQTTSKKFDIELAYELINLYYEKLVSYSEFQINLIENTNFDFTINEYLDIFEDDNEWQINISNIEEIWRLETKNDLLVAKLSDSSSDNPKDDISKRYKNRLRRIAQQKEEDIFSLAMNILTNQFDPHSSYLSPRSAEDFDMNMSLKLSGIGALLGVDDDYTKVISLVPGGPAEKSGKIKPEDRISKIKQVDEDEFTDVVGWRIDEVVDLIRGDIDTEVQIEFISFESDIDNRKIVTLKREEVKLEDRAAQSDVFEIDENKIGVIDLPSFYIDFEEYAKRNTDYKSSSKDVKNILEEFNASGIDAVILDLRNNGGGALIEANKIIGLFVSSGPTVQVKQKRGFIQPYGDTRAIQVWDKPVIVLVNRYSASASEIVAGAIQDYRRGLVVGQRTFGKGTVQSLEDLSEGQIKITESKYYRINGKSTQNKGVVPDIELPVTWDIDSVGESSYPTALQWDVIRPYRHKKFVFDTSVIENVLELHKDRLTYEPNLNYLKDVRKRYDLNKDKKFLSLKIQDRKNQKILRKNWLLEIENKRRNSLGFDEFASYEDLESFNKENDDEVNANRIDFENDFQLIESAKIVNDYLGLKQEKIITMVN